ncbi:MAG TPA: TOBE domain-containing protein [Nitrospiraceae bacterium]|nr:TOBE domain-containing protein [Nitrospiraceae bacterium]
MERRFSEKEQIHDGQSSSSIDEVTSPSSNVLMGIVISKTEGLTGNVTKINEGQAMAEVIVKVGNLEFVAAITEGSIKNMGLKVGDSVTVAVKATEVMIGK